MAPQLWTSLSNGREYRQAFVEEALASRITAQIHELRIRNGWDYKTFADKLGKKLSWAYRLEDATATPPTLPTLFEVAAVCDVALDVRFLRFSELVRDVTTLEPTSFAVPSFDEECYAGMRDKPSQLNFSQIPISNQTKTCVRNESVATVLSIDSSPQYQRVSATERKHMTTEIGITAEIKTLARNK